MWNWSFIVRCFESALVTGMAAFTGTTAITTISVHSLEAGAVAAGLATLYQFVKNLGSTQTIKALRSLTRGAPNA